MVPTPPQSRFILYRPEEASDDTAETGNKEAEVFKQSISNLIQPFTSLKKPVIDSQHENPGNVIVSDGSSNGLTTQSYHRPQKKQKNMTEPAMMPQNQYCPGYNTNNYSINQTGYHSSWKDAPGEYCTMSEDPTQSADTVTRLFNNGAQYAVQHSAASLDDVQEDPNYNPQAQRFSLYGSGDTSNISIEVPTLEPQVACLFANSVLNTNEACCHQSVTFGNQAMPNSGYGPRLWSINDMPDAAVQPNCCRPSEIHRSNYNITSSGPDSTSWPRGAAASTQSAIGNQSVQNSNYEVSPVSTVYRTANSYDLL
jgi:hypothetical protein